MAKVVYDIVKAPKPDRAPKESKEGERKGNRTKNMYLAKTLLKLCIGDYVIARKDIPTVMIRETTANVKYSIKKWLGDKFTKFSFHYMDASSGTAGLHDVIVKREV